MGEPPRSHCTPFCNIASSWPPPCSIEHPTLFSASPMSVTIMAGDPSPAHISSPVSSTHNLAFVAREPSKSLILEVMRFEGAFDLHERMSNPERTSDIRSRSYERPGRTGNTTAGGTALNELSG